MKKYTDKDRLINCDVQGSGERKRSKGLYFGWLGVTKASTPVRGHDNLSPIREQAGFSCTFLNKHFIL